MKDPHQRTARPGDALRLLRAAVFAAVCVVLAGAGHTLASCESVPPWTLGAGFLAALAVVLPLSGRERSMPAIATLLAVGQALMHTLFGLGQHGASTVAAAGEASSAAVSDATLVERATRLVCGAAATPISPAQAYRILVEARLYPAGAGTGATAWHHQDALSAGGASAAWLPWPSTSLLPSLPMLLAHVLAAVAAGWVLRRGDSALMRLVELSAHGVAEGALVRSLRGAFALVRALIAGLPTAPETGPRPPRLTPDTPAEPGAEALQHSVIRRGPPAGALVLAA